MKKTLLATLATAILLSPGITFAQSTVEDALKERWAAILKAREGIPEAERATRAPIATLTNQQRKELVDARKQFYRAAIEELLNDPNLAATAEIENKALVVEQVRAYDRRVVKGLQDVGAENKLARNVDSRSTNPVTAGLTERSGFTDLIALALNGNGFLSANQSAVTLNLSALALYSAADPAVFSTLHDYRRHSVLRRLGGSVTFGAKIPEKEITGISGLPNAETLLDALVWDVKFRVWGDRDARSQIRYPTTLGAVAVEVQAAELIPTVVGADVETALLLRELFNERLGTRLAEAKKKIDRSPQLTLKTAGTHLRNEAGKNKFSGELLFDVGVSPKTDFTANLLYSVTDDVQLGPEQLSKVKKLTFNASITTHFAQDAIVKGRAVDWNSGVAVNTFRNKSSLPIPVDNTWKLFTTFEIPVTDAAKVPLSVVYSNDPNALTKQKYVSGFVGINYDFSALGKLFKGD